MSAHITKAIIGGVDHVVGGWAAYEVTRRHARWAAVRGVLYGSTPDDERPGHRYRPLTHVCATDVASSVLASTSAGSTAILRDAANRLATAVGRQERRNMAGVVWELRWLDASHYSVPTITAKELSEFAESAHARTDAGSIEDVSEAVRSIAASCNLGVALPDMPPAHANVPAMRLRVPATDDDAVIELEALSIPLIESIAAKQAALAVQLDLTARALELREVALRNQHTAPGC